MEPSSLEEDGSPGEQILRFFLFRPSLLSVSGINARSFGPGYYWYNAYSCYSVLEGGKQTLAEYGGWTADGYGMDAKEVGLTHMNLSVNLIGGPPYQAGALLSFPAAASGPTTITIRVGVSFVSAQQACSNLQEEVGTASFEDVEAASKALWNQKLNKVELDLANTNANVTEMFYSSMYRSFLTPNNATGEGNGLFAGTSSPFFDSLVSQVSFAEVKQF